MKKFNYETDEIASGPRHTAKIFCYFYFFKAGNESNRHRSPGFNILTQTQHANPLKTIGGFESILRDCIN